MLQLETLVEALESVCLEEGLAVLATTPEGRIKHWSRAAAELYGYPPGHVLDEPVTLLAAPAGFSHLVDMLTAARRGREVAPTQTLHLRDDGTRVPVVLRVSAVSGEGYVLAARRCGHTLDRRYR